MFHKLSELDWTKGLIFIGALTVFWTAIHGVIPEPYHDKILTLLGALSGAIGFWLKGGKET